MSGAPARTLSQGARQDDPNAPGSKELCSRSTRYKGGCGLPVIIVHGGTTDHWLCVLHACTSFRAAIGAGARSSPFRAFAAPPPTITPARLESLEVPVAFMVGEKTRPHFPARLHAACRAMSTGSVTVIPDAHRADPFENSEAFNAALLSHPPWDGRPAAA